MKSVSDFILWIYLHTGDFDTVIFALPFIILITFIYWLSRLIFHKKKLGDEFGTIRRKAHLNETIRLLTVCWSCALLCLVLSPTGFWMHFWECLIVGLDPFKDIISGRFGEIIVIPEILRYILNGHHEWILLEARAFLPHLLLNILLFVPLGSALPFLGKQTTFIKTVLTGFSLSFLIEFIQFFIGRSCEMDDLICNTLGAALGYILYLLFKKIFPGFTEKGRTSVYQISKNDPIL